MLGLYVLRRLLLLVPTLFVVISLNFLLLQWLPGGPVESALAKLQGVDNSAVDLFDSVESAQSDNVIDQQLQEKIAKEYGFDKPLSERYKDTVSRYMSFELGNSYFNGLPVSELILDKLTVSLSLGGWTLFITYFIAVPLGVAKASRQGSVFDSFSSFVLLLAYAVPTFIIAIIFLMLFAGGGVFNWFPLRGLVSSNHNELSLTGQILDYFWHLALPVLACVASGLASLTVLTKNSILDQMSEQYVDTAICMGESKSRAVIHHVLPNTLLVIVARLPSDLLSVFIGGTLLVEIVFSLDGIALLGFEALLERDYPVVLGILYVYTILGLILNLIGDLLYRLVDPRVSFSEVSG
ncbi:ABC transporter permease subunit [Vibrio fortis]|uniref:ABC transporter permease subunit n=1 Tax=Vibrio fortis TaxID=212667 RepID=A0A5N3S262_9VIBR|nr:ABC transporter permease subunit [Vibrio fortis]KAB0300155.1 ABC transporter permease subunit [Vibrio fortis]|tara:strand:- start:4019 stop:5074 length:1056 start_codon:yes stop_codon:yes gene_type:complete